MDRKGGNHLPPKKGGRGRARISIRNSDGFLHYRDRDIVLDTSSDFLYIGKLDSVSEYFVTLRDVDVHDRRESPSLNEKYIIDAKKYGIRRNRKLVHVRLEEVVSFSLLEDVLEY